MNVYKLEAAIGLNSTEYQKGLKSAGESMAAMGNKIKAGAAAIGKATAAGMAAGVAGVTALTKSVVSAYADYEQLTGGVEKLFGESSDLLMLYAKDAYKTAGLSMNAYMETATSFAAALTTSVQAAGGSMDEAVELADTAMSDMSDNANTFGTDIASIQTAYQGFAKQNYTMLDNLKLGYGGTKAEMERLIEDANKIRHEQGINNDLTIESYADIITAIHDVQTQMKITGTTAREASKTISGSIGAAKAAWQNLTIEMGKDNGDIGGAFSAFGETIGNVADNLIPRIEQSIGGIGDLIAAAAPQVTSGIKRLLPKVLPTLVKTAGSLVSSVGSAVMQSIPELMDLGGNMLESFTNNAPYLFQTAQQMVTNLANQLLNVDYKKLGSSFSKIFTSAINSITDLVQSIDFYKVGENIADFLNSINWQEVANSIFDLIGAGIKALPDIAVSFFANADLGNLMTMIGLLGAPKLLGGITDYISSDEGQSLGQSAGASWSGAFMAGIKAFGLGWAIGTYIREQIIAATGSEDEANEKIVTYAGSKAMLDMYVAATDKNASMGGGNERMFTDEKGRQGRVYNENGELSAAYKMYLSRQTAQTYNALKDFNLDEYRKANNLPAYGNGGRVTSPTIALVGEKEPETIVPDSKLGMLGSTFNVTLNINGTFNANDPIERRQLIEEVSRELKNLEITNGRAMGGAAW